MTAREVLGDGATPVRRRAHRSDRRPSSAVISSCQRSATWNRSLCLLGRAREAESRQARHDHVERVARIAAVRRRVDQESEQLQEPEKRIRVAVGQHEGQRPVAAALVSWMKCTVVPPRLAVK